MFLTNLHHFLSLVQYYIKGSCTAMYSSLIACLILRGNEI